MADREQRIIDRVREELTAVDWEISFADMLNECYTFESVGGPFSSMTPADVLKAVDPTAFRCGASDHSDNYEEIDGEYYDRDEVKAIRDEIDEEIEAEEAAEAEEADADETEDDDVL